MIWKSDNRTVIRDLKQIADQSERTRRRMKVDSEQEELAMRKVGAAAESTRGMVRGLAGAVGFLGLTIGMKDAIMGGAKLETSQLQLQSALRATGAAAK